MHRTALAVILCAVMVTIGCTPVEQDARNAAAGLGGSLAAAQAKYQSSCSANPSQPVCQTINKGVAGQNALITSIETYCGWSTTAPPDLTAKCVPVTSAKAGLLAAISNANALTVQLKGAF